MAHRVIDQFQAVQIDHDQADRSIQALVDALHFFFKIGPVVNSGQGVVKTSVLQQHFRFLAFADFALGFPIQKRVFICDRRQIGDLVQHFDIIGGKAAARFRVPQADDADDFTGAFQGEVHHRFRQGIGGMCAVLPLLVIVDQNGLPGLVHLSGSPLVDGVSGAEHGAGRTGGDHPDPLGPVFVEQQNAAGRRAGNFGRLIDDGLQQVHNIAAIHDFQRGFMQKRQQLVAALHLHRRAFLVAKLVEQ